MQLVWIQLKEGFSLWKTFEVLFHFVYICIGMLEIAMEFRGLSMVGIGTVLRWAIPINLVGTVGFWTHDVFSTYL